MAATEKFSGFQPPAMIMMRHGSREVTYRLLSVLLAGGDDGRRLVV